MPNSHKVPNATGTTNKMDAGKAPRSAQAEAKGLWKWRDTIMVVEGFENHPDEHWFKLVMQHGAHAAVAVEKTLVIHFKSAHQTAMFAQLLEKAKEHGRNFTMAPHPSAPHFSNNEIIEQTWRKAHREAQEVTKTQMNPFTKCTELEHTWYPGYQARAVISL